MTEEVKTPHISVKIPTLPESVTEATILKWYKQDGERVKAGEHLADIETDKVILEVTAPEDGILKNTHDISLGKVFNGSELIAQIMPDNGDSGTSSVVAKDEEGKSNTDSKKDDTVEVGTTKNPDQVAVPTSTSSSDTTSSKDTSGEVRAMPAASKIAADNNVNLSNIKGSGRDERILKEDVLASLSNAGNSSRIEERVPMSRLRQKIAQRLIQSQQTNAILTTFNEVNMQAIMDLRSKYKDKFEKKHEIKLGFMSFFVKAVVNACKEYPVLNAFIDGTDIVYHGYIDIGIAVSSPRGLVVPILRDAQNMSISDIETAIGHYAKKARDGKLELDDLTGGTLSITNGGTFGSMMSTPIINPPQSAILGMHAIKDRAMVEDGKIVIRPMMYLALSYDHRLIDGREAVSALVAIKEALEDPTRLLLGV